MAVALYRVPCKNLIHSLKKPKGAWMFFFILVLVLHLRFKQAQPKICHSHKVEDGVENYFFFFLDPYVWTFFSCPEQL